MLAVILSVSGYFIYDVAIADHSRSLVCYDCHTLKADDILPNTSSLLAGLFTAGEGAGVQNTNLCEVCHGGIKLTEFDPTSYASQHPVHLISNYTDAFTPAGYWSNNDDPGYPDNASEYTIGPTQNAIECFNCHNSNQVTDRGPDLTANGYPDHTWELVEFHLGGVDAVTLPPPYDYLRYHLYGIASEGSGQGGGGADDEFDYMYDNSNFNTCFGGADLLNKKPGIRDTIYDAGSTGSVPGCHGTDPAYPRIVDTHTQDVTTGFAIEEYYNPANPGNYVAPAGKYGHYVKADDGRIACYECHDAHGSEFNARLYNGPNRIGGALDTVSKICRGCHAYESPGDGLQPINITIDTSFGVDQSVNPGAPPDAVVEHTLAGEQPCYLCHNAHNPTPDLDDPDCAMCHLSKLDPSTNHDVDNYLFGDGNFDDKAVIDRDQWTTGGHGTYGNLPVNNRILHGGQPTGQQGPDLGCIDNEVKDAGTGDERVVDGCHTDTVAHGVSTNPYRLLGASAYNPAFPANVCFRSDALNFGIPCHGGLGAPEIGDHNFVGGFVNSVCFDCHDPHGDTSMADASLPGSDPQAGSSIPDANLNASMLHRQPVYDDRWTIGTYGDATGKIREITRYVATDSYWDFIKETAGESAICEVCHDPTKTAYFEYNNTNNEDPSTFPLYHRYTEPGGIKLCIDCHKHPTQFVPSLCTDCHIDVQGARPQIVYEDANGDFHFYDNSDAVPKAMSRHGKNDGDDSYITDVECVLCHLEGVILENPAPDTGTYRVEVDLAYHDRQPNMPTDLRNMATGGEAVVGGYYPNNDGDLDGYADDAWDLNADHCGGCHDSTGAEWWAGQWGSNAMQPFNNGPFIDDIELDPLGGNDDSPVPDVWTQYNSEQGSGYDNGGNANASSWTYYSKYDPATYNVVPQLPKAYSPHGNLAENQTKSEYADTTYSPSATFTNTKPVACLHCHPPHGSDTLTLHPDFIPDKEGAYTQLGAEIVMAKVSEPYLCWNCHAKDAADVWDFYGDHNRTGGARPVRQWGGETATDNWERAGAFDFKDLGASTRYRSFHDVATMSPTAVDPVPGGGPEVVCGVCHDPHGIDVTATNYEYFLVPILRPTPGKPNQGGWLSSPYREDAPPTAMAGVAPESPVTASGNVLSFPGGSYPTEADWVAGVGPRTEPYNTSLANRARFQYCDPPLIGGGYGDTDLGDGGSGNYGFFINDNTFGTTGTPIWIQSGALSGPTPVDFSNANLRTGDTATVDETAIYGFCQNCHFKTGLDKNSTRWKGHGAVYGQLAFSDCFTQAVARKVHGGPGGGTRTAQRLIPNDTQSAGAANKWATSTGNAGNWQGAGDNITNYHQFSCSKCHTPHASVLDALMRTNCISGSIADGAGGWAAETKTPSQILGGTTSGGPIDKGNFTDTATTNRAVYGFPTPTTGVLDEAHAMHCHNSWEMTQVAGTTSSAGTNADSAPIAYDAGWLSPMGGGGPRNCGTCWSGKCHEYFPNYYVANNIETISGIPGSALLDPVDAIIRSGAHRVHLDLAFESGVTYFDPADTGGRGFIDSNGDLLSDSFGLGNPGGELTGGNYLNCDYCHVYEPVGSVPPYTNYLCNDPQVYHNTGTLDFDDPAGSTKTTTNVCNPCHDPANTENSQTAKDNWGGSTDDSYTRIPCLSCHNKDSGAWSTAGAVDPLPFDLLGVTDIQGANIKGDLANQGFFVNGHGMDNRFIDVDNGDQYEDGDPGADFHGDDNDPASWDPGTDLGLPLGTPDDGVGDDGCIYCHNMSKPHIDAVNDFSDGSHDFRIEEGNFPTVVDITDVTEVCADCHDPDGGPYGRNNARPANAAAYDNDVSNHDSGTMGFWGPAPYPQRGWGFEAQCHDCHDLHGSTNYRMVGSNHNGKVPTANTTNKAYYDITGAAPNNAEVDLKAGTYEQGRVTAPKGPCVACHINTTHDRNTDPNNFHPLSGNMNGKLCTSCHPHGPEGPFTPMPCDGCHGVPPGFSANDSTGAADAADRTACDAATGPAIGPVEQPCDNVEYNEGHAEYAPENGAHIIHTFQYLNDPNPAFLGLPKLGQTCLDTGCHVNISDGGATDHQPGDDIAEVDFDLLDTEIWKAMRIRVTQKTC
jgi:predicted CXXCH cytochrome family protein